MVYLANEFPDLIRTQPTVVPCCISHLYEVAPELLDQESSFIADFMDQRKYFPVAVAHAFHAIRIIRRHDSATRVGRYVDSAEVYEQRLTMLDNDTILIIPLPERSTLAGYTKHGWRRKC